MYDFTLTRRVWFKSNDGRDCIAHQLAALMISDRSNAPQYNAIVALVRRYE